MTATLVNNPFLIDVSRALRATSAPATISQEGPSPSHVGLEMIGFDEGTPVHVEAHLTPLDGAVVVRASIRATVQATCVRCLSSFSAEEEFSFEEVFAEDPHTVFSDSSAKTRGEDADDEEEAVAVVKDGFITITQCVIDAAGLDLPFNPVCEEYGLQCDTSALGDTDYSVCAAEEDSDDDTLQKESARVDPRWAGLEKFK